MGNEANILASMAAVIGPYINTGNPSEVRFQCPMCVSRGKSKPDTKHHMYYNTQKEVWICFRCGASGHSTTIVGDEDELMVDVDVWGSLDEILSDIDPSAPSEGERVDSPKRRLSYPCEVREVVPGTEAFRYLSNRAMTEDDIGFYRIVYGKHQAFSQDGRKIGQPVPRVFIPTYHEKSMVFWVGRRFYSTQFRAPKYVNPTSLDKEHVFNLDKASGHIIITEGVFSGMAAGRHGVSMFGKEPTSAQIKALIGTNADEYVMSLDGDAIPEGLELSRYLFYAGKTVSFVELPVGDDPDSVSDFDRYLDNRLPVDMEFLIKMELVHGIGRYGKWQGN